MVTPGVSTVIGANCVTPRSIQTCDVELYLFFPTAAKSCDTVGQKVNETIILWCVDLVELNDMLSVTTQNALQRR